MFQLERRGVLGPGQQCAGFVLLPVGGESLAGEFGRGLAADRHGFMFGGELLHRQYAPGVGHRGVPAALVLAGEGAAHEAADVLFPVRVVIGGQQQPIRVDVTIPHQPPPGVVAFGRESHHRAGKIQPAFQDGLRFFQSLFTLGQIRHALVNGDPVEQGGGGPQIGRMAEAVEPGRIEGRHIVEVLVA